MDCNTGLACSVVEQLYQTGFVHFIYMLLIVYEGIKGPVQSKSMFISIDQLPKIIEIHTIIVQNYSSVDFILIFFDTSAAILKNLKLY